MKYLIILTIFASILLANTIIVDQTGNGDYYTITEAYNASASGDTIFIRSGVYPEGLLEVEHIVHFVGEDKYSVTWTFADNNYMVRFNGYSSGSSINNITFLGSYVYCVENLDVYNCIFNNSYINIFYCVVNANNSVFINDYAFYAYGGIDYCNLINCIFYNNNSNAFDDLDYLTFQNCIFINCPDNTPGGNASISITYSCFYNSEFVYGYGNINSNPLIVDIANGNYRLQAGSPCIDTGNPAANQNDPDGSRNDMGVYGGPNSWRGLGPVITNIQVTPEQLNIGEPINIQATGTVE